MVSERFLILLILFAAKFILIVLAFYYSLFKRQFILCYIKWVSFLPVFYSGVYFLCDTYILRFVDVKRYIFFQVGIKLQKKEEKVNFSRNLNTQWRWFSRDKAMLNVMRFITLFLCAFHLALKDVFTCCWCWRNSWLWSS